MSPADDRHPFLWSCPYLNLHKSYNFADFWIGPLDQFQGPWHPPELEASARLFLSRFTAVDGRPLRRAVIVATSEAGVTGELPRDCEALELAIAFGALIRNPKHPIDRHQAWKVITADNCDLWVQPIDIGDRWVTLARGLRVATWSGGIKFDDPDFRIPAPLELHTDGVGSFDPDVAEAVFRAASEPDATNDPHLARRVATAIRWWVQAWRNSASITWEDRVVYLRTAMDALAGSDKTVDVVRWLNGMFSRVDAESRSELLWAESSPTFPRTRPNRNLTEDLPGFEHWLWSFADARNAIIHEGAPAALVYEQPGSPYSGHHVHVADRVVAEAILVALHQCGFEYLWPRGGGLSPELRTLIEGTN